MIPRSPSAWHSAFLRSRLQGLGCLLYIAVPVLVLVPLSFLLFHDPPDDDLEARTRAAIATKNYAAASELLAEQVQNDPSNIKLHYRYIHAATKARSPGENSKAIDWKKKIAAEYSSLSQQDDPDLRDIGFYGLGLMSSMEKNYEDALSHFRKVENPRLPYLNNSIGYVYWKRGEQTRAEAAFRKELDTGGNLAGAVANLARLLAKQGRYDDLVVLYEHSEWREEFPINLVRLVHWRQGRVIEYGMDLFLYSIKGLNWPGAIGALLGSALWYFFLRRLDIFEPEKHRYLILTFLGGVLFSIPVLIPYDLSTYWFQFDLKERWVPDLVYCVFGIGLFEETAKMIPFLLVLWLTREINESIDYIIYASVSALGFAFAENLVYFNESGLAIMETRSLMSVLLHMVDSALVAYGLFLARYRSRGNPVFYFLLFFFLACLLHGLFDFWILSEAVPKAGALLSFAIAIGAIALYRWMIVNALNQSEYFRTAAVSQLGTMGRYLAIGFVGVIMFQYYVLAALFGPHLTLLRYADSYLILGLILLLLYKTLSHYELRRATSFDDRRSSPGPVRPSDPTDPPDWTEPGSSC